MPMITIQGQEFFYDESETISFAEGLIGLPEMRRAVLVSMNGCAPFCWLASIDDEKNRFIVVNPREIFADYDPAIVAEKSEPVTQTLAIVKVSSDWQKTTVNLRAPIFVDAETRRGAQIILTESTYGLAEAITQN